MKRKLSFGVTLLLMLSILLLASACGEKECEHSYQGAVTKAATCESDGVMTYTCSLCTDSYTEVIKALTHDEVSHEAKAPTCTEIGWDEYVTCSRCDYTTYAEKPALGHTDGETAVENNVAPDCTRTGSYDSVIYCSVCDAELSRNTVNVPANGHSFGEWYITKAPTEAESGAKRRDCKNCAHFETGAVAPLSHDHTRWETITLEAVAPTCTETGLTEGKKCSGCGEILVAQETVKVLDHNEIPHDAKAPTCTEHGWDAYVTCSRCDYTTYVEKPALTHDEIPHDAKAPTCTEIGWDAYVTCSRCDYSTYAKKPALTHDEIPHDAKAPTCTEHGWDAYVTCSRCDYTTYVEKPALTHDEIPHDAKAPTCTEHGWDAYVTCSRCDYTTYAPIKETGHSHNAAVTKPTCTEKGYTTHTCHCGDKYIDTYVDALGHTEVTDEAVAPTCTKTGLTEGSHCSVCNTVLVAQTVVPANGHSFGEWYITKEPTEAESGAKRRDCKNCAHFETGVVAPLSHDHARWNVIILDAVAPDCVNTGLTEGKKCSGCGETLVAQETVKALGHNAIPHEAKAPTCTEHGWDAYVTCSRCDYTTYAPIKETGHSHNAAVTKPTCTEKGYTTHTCHCGDTYVDTYVDALGHTEVTDEAVAPTCTKTGLTEGKHCSVCEDVLVAQETVKALGHNEIPHEAKAPTCTEHGWDAYVTCSRCDYTTYAPIKETGHSHNAVVTKPTCTEKGYTTHTCHCGDTYVDTYVDALGHTEVTDEAVAPTCTNTGLTEGSHCSACGEIFNAQNSIDALGHIEHNYEGKAATCTDFGWEAYFICDREVCGYSSYKEIAALGHDEVHHAEIPATCQAVGYSAYVTCSRCDYKTTPSEIATVEHCFVDYVLSGAQYCTQAGEETASCVYGCGETKTRIVAAGMHKPLLADRYVPSTDYVDGYHEFWVECSTCNKELLHYKYTIPAKTTNIRVENDQKWSENDLLHDVPFPNKDKFPLISLYLRNANTELDGYYGFAGGTFDFSDYGDVTSYINELKYGEFNHFVESNAYSFTGYNADKSLKLVVSITHLTNPELSELSIMVYKLVYYKSPEVTNNYGYYGWENNVLLRYAAYPSSGNLIESSYILDSVNTSGYDSYGKYYGKAGAQFYITAANAAYYMEKLAKAGIFCSDVTRTETSYIGYDVDAKFRIEATYDTDMQILTVMVYKLIDARVEEFTGNEEHTHKYNTYSIEPQCNQYGITIHYCDCGHCFQTKTLPTGHNNVEVYTDVAPTCTESGLTIGEKCLDCRALLIEQKELLPLGHEDVEGYCSRCRIPIEYHIDFVINGNVVETRTYTVESTGVTLPTIPEKKGHTGKWAEFELNRTNFTVEATYTPNNYKITYVLNGGTNADENPETYTFGDFIELKAPSINEPLVIFGGWFTDPSFTDQFAIKNITYLDDGDITLYAQWIYYRIESANGFEIDYDAYMPTLRIRVPSASVNFDFKGKITVSKNCTWKVYGDEYSSISYDMKLVPLTDSNNVYYIVVFHPDGEYYTQYRVEIYRRESYTYEYRDFVGNVIASGNYDEDSALPSATPPVYDGFTFVGWSDGENIIEENAVPDKNIVLTPVYSANYKVEYYLENVDKTDYELLAAGEAEGLTNEIMTAEVIEIPHFTFNSDKSVISGSFSVTDELVLKVYYTRNTYKIIATTSNGTVTCAGDHPYGSLVDLTTQGYPGYELSAITVDGEDVFDYIDYKVLIEGDVYVEAEFYNVAPDMENFEFTSTQTTCTITGIKDKTVTEIIVPDYVTAISGGAFSGCSNLESLTIPFVGGSKSATSASSSTLFGYIFGTSSYTGEVSTTQYYNSSSSATYYIPSWLESVTVTGGNILYGAFYNCTSLTNITIPDSVTSIGDYAFYRCDGLTSVTIGNSVTSIGNYAFYSCDGLTSVTIGNSVTSIGERAFENCTSLTSVNIPDSVTTIGEDAFYDCDSLTSVNIPDSVTTIGNSAFYSCNKLVEVVNNSTLNIASGSSSYGYVAYYAIEVHTGESKIVNKDNYLFYSYNGVNYLLGYIGEDKALILPENYNGESYEIYQYAFYERSDITGVVIPDSVTSIGDYAFYYCTSLTSVTIGDSVTSIGDYAFYCCTSLTSVTIGDSVTTIGYDAFSSCDSLTSVTIPDSVTTIGGRAFSFCDSLTSVTIGDSVTTIGEYAFRYCRSLTSVTIGDSVTAIGNSAFYNCDSLTSVTIPDSVTTISNYAFYNCTSLTSITIPDSVTSIGSYAFYNCDSLTSITIPDSVTSIGEYAFNSCDSLTSVTIPDSVTSIGPYAFNCTSLTSVIFENPNGWWRSSSSTATSGTSISASNLSNTSTAATYLKSTYCDCFWKRT